MNSATFQKGLTAAIQKQLTEERYAPEYSHILKMWPMKVGCPAIAIRARTAKKYLAGWPSPKAQESGCSVEAAKARMKRAREKYEAGLYGSNSGPPSMNDLNHLAQLAGWPSPQVFDCTDCQSSEAALLLPKEKGGCSNLREIVALAGWPTTKSSDGHNGLRTEEGALAEFERKGTGADLPTMAALAGWKTPTLGDSKNVPYQHNGHAKGEKGISLTLTGEALLAGWTSPTCQDAANTAGPSQMERNTLPLNAQATLSDSGTATDSSPAKTESSGEFHGTLNPFFSLWLMGYPPGWMQAGLRAKGSRSRAKSPTASDYSEGQETPSSRKSRRRSSAPFSKSKRQKESEGEQ